MSADEWSWPAILGTLGLYNALLSAAAFWLGSSRYGGVLGAVAAVCMAAVQLLQIRASLDESES